MYGALLRSLDSLSGRAGKEAFLDPGVPADDDHLDDAELKGQQRRGVRDDPVASKRLWLTEASLARLTEKVLSNAELAALKKQDQDKTHKLDYEKLDASGLSDIEKSLVNDWVRGKVSGRHCLCMLAAAENAENPSSSSFSSSSPSSPEAVGVLQTLSPDNLHSLLATMVSFPRSVIDRDSNVLFEKVFAKPPIVCLFEILKAIARRAKEKSTKFLRVEQVNLAFKQMRLEKIQSKDEDVEVHEANDENAGSGNANDSANVACKEAEAAMSPSKSWSPTAKERGRSRRSSDMVEVRALRIMMELVRMFYAGHFKAVSQQPDDEKTHEEHGTGEDENRVDADVIEPDVASAEILKEVEISRDKVVEESREMSHTELDRLNRPIKSYIAQLAGLKTTLSVQLREIEESGAYLDLGVTKDMSDNEIKKAYHSLAVKIHPDKPGGDTAKFQALQASYHEIVAARRTGLGKDSVGKDSDSLEGVEKAFALQREIAALVAICKSAAEQIGVMAQVVLHALKMVEKTIKKSGFPKCAQSLFALLMGKDENKKDGPIELLMNTVEPTEAIAASIQDIATKATELSSCGVHFAVATTTCMGFNKAVEETMKTGLDVLRTIASMLSIEAHASTCLEKMRNSQHLVLVDKDVHNIIVEMMLTVVRSCAVSLKGTADKAVGATVSASELQDMVEGIISTAKSEAADAARRDAEYEERKADATAMGDLEGFLEAQSMKGKSTGQTSPEKEEKKDGEEESKTEEEEDNSLEGLKDKVRRLQLQVRVQNVAILQTMTAEIHGMQRKMHSEVQRISELPGFSIVVTEHKQRGATSYHYGQIMALLADLVDHSLIAIREECYSGNIVSGGDWRNALAQTFRWMTQLRPAKLALWPDLRTRALLLAALVDLEEVCTMIDSELRSRLGECLKDSPVMSHMETEEWSIDISSFCSNIVQGVSSSVRAVQGMGGEEEGEVMNGPGDDEVILEDFDTAFAGIDVDAVEVARNNEELSDSIRKSKNEDSEVEKEKVDTEDELVVEAESEVKVGGAGEM